MKLIVAFLIMCHASVVLGHDLIDTLRSRGNFTIFLRALELTHLEQSLEKGNFTLMAPTDMAFAKLPQGLLESLIKDPQALKAILLFHVSLGKKSLAKIQSQSGLKTLSGKFLMIESIVTAGLSETDIKADNGILHALDNVLIPNEFTPNNEVQTVSFVDIQQYMGKWYEIARFEQSFQKGCVYTTAEYTLRPNGKVDVLNTCRLENGIVRQGKAIGHVVDKKTNSKLKVSFVPFFNRFGLFAGDYWIIGLGDKYEYAIVASPDRQSLWFLSRSPAISDEMYDILLKKASSQGFDVRRLMRASN